MSRPVIFCSLLLLLFAAACSSSGGAPSPCRPVDPRSGVSVYFEHGVLPRTGDVSITACVDAACRTRVSSAAEANAFVPVPLAPTATVVQVRVRVQSGHGAKLFGASTPARTKVIQQRGAHCEAPAGLVNVIAHGNGKLTVAP
jgi:hypothetical protein